MNLQAGGFTRTERAGASRHHRAHPVFWEVNVGKFALSAFVALAMFMPGCSKNTVTSPSSQSLTGTWGATKAEYVSAADPSITYDVVAQGGTATLVLTSNTFTLTIAKAGAAPQITNGSYTSTSDLMTLTPAGMSFTWVFEMSLSGDNLILNGANVEFDFNGDRTNEPAKLNLALVRQ
jgi:hypothetical protein